MRRDCVLNAFGDRIVAGNVISLEASALISFSTISPSMVVNHYYSLSASVHQHRLTSAGKTKEPTLLFKVRHELAINMPILTNCLGNIFILAWIHHEALSTQDLHEFWCEVSNLAIETFCCQGDCHCHSSNPSIYSHLLHSFLDPAG